MSSPKYCPIIIIIIIIINNNNNNNNTVLMISAIKLIPTPTSSPYWEATFTSHAIRHI